jgi:SRSO17 transposase
MTQRLACPPAPGPLEDYARQFDDRFETLAQRRGFREYLQGLLLPRDRNKTLTALVGAEPIVGAQQQEVQRLQFFLSESPWEAADVNDQRLALLFADPATAPHAEGVLVIDETGDRKDGTKTAHVGRQYLGSIGKTDNGIVAVTSLWADERIYYPLHVQPYTPAPRFAEGKADPAFRTKPQIAVELVHAARTAGVPFRAVVADCLYGDNPTFERSVVEAGLPFVVGIKPSRSIWAPNDAVHNPQEALPLLRWNGPADPGDWTKVVRRFRDGHTETWWAVDLVYGPYGPTQARRIVVATTDPETLPDLTTWYLMTNLPPPNRETDRTVTFTPADLAEVIRLYALRNWVEQSYRQVKRELGWADFMVRTDRAIRRHWVLVCCAFSFCWQQWFATTLEPPRPTVTPPTDGPGGRGEKPAIALVAQSGPPRPRMAGSVEFPLALLARVVERAPAPGNSSAPPLGR